MRRSSVNYMSPSVESILGYPPSYFLEDFDRMLEILDDDGRTAIGLALRGDMSSSASTSTFVTPTARSSSAKRGPLSSAEDFRV